MANDWQSSGMNTYNMIRLAVGISPPPRESRSPWKCERLLQLYSTRILYINNGLWTHLIIDHSLQSMSMQFSGDHDSHSTVAFSSLPFLIKKKKHVRDKPDR